MNIATIRPAKTALIVLIAAIASGVWVPRQVRLVQARRWIDDAKSQKNISQDRLSSANTALESAQRELRAANARNDEIFAAIAKAEQLLATKDPEARWAAPPAMLPEWNSDSPYVWLRKDLVTRLPVSPFNEDGELQPEVGYVLVIDPAVQRALNKRLKQLLQDYRALEVAKAERIDEHLPGIAGAKGEKLTIRVQPRPEDGARIKQQFEAALLDALGEQRAGLLKKAGSTWLNSEFAQFGAEPKIISVVRHSADSFNVSIKTGGSWISTGGPASATLIQIPVHLRPLFSELFDRADTAGAARENL